jgi:hypothetical protein
MVLYFIYVYIDFRLGYVITVYGNKNRNFCLLQRPPFSLSLLVYQSIPVYLLLWWLQ